MPHVVEYFGQSLKAALSRRINMVTFANLSFVRLPSLKFVGVRVRKIRRIQCQLSIYNSFPVIRTTIEKNRHFFSTTALIFCLPRGRPCGNHAKRCTNEKTIQCLSNPPHHVPICLQQFPSYSNRKCKNSPFSRTATHIFVSPGDAPGAITLNVVWMERQFDAYKLSLCMCPSKYNRF